MYAMSNAPSTWMNYAVESHIRRSTELDEKRKFVLGIIEKSADDPLMSSGSGNEFAGRSQLMSLQYYNRSDYSSSMHPIF